jgi:polar amino acid transport system permease protein
MLDLTLQTLPFLLEGFVNTILISLAAIFWGSLAGLFLGMGRTVGPKALDRVIGFYVHLVRATPFLVQIYIVYYVLPTTGFGIFDMSNFAAAVLALTIYTSSYTAEIVRGSLQAVPQGQWEAAAAVGMTMRQRLFNVILPQAWKLTLPPLAGVYVLVIKGTSILTVIGVVELMRQGEDAIHRHPAHIMPILFLVAAMYFLYCFPILRGIRWMEARIGGQARGIAKSGNW